MSKGSTARQSKQNARTRQHRPTPQPMERQRPVYSEEEKIRAVTIVLDCGGLTKESITLARQTLGSNVGTTSLARWLLQYGDQVKASHPDLRPRPVDLPAIVAEQHESIISRLNGIVGKLLDHMEDDKVINKAELRDASVSLGIYLDKIKSLRNISSDVEQRLTKLDLACQRAALPMLDVLDDVIAAIETRSIQHTVIDTKSLPSGID